LLLSGNFALKKYFFACVYFLGGGYRGYICIDADMTKLYDIF